MLAPDLFRALLALERRIVDVSRLARELQLDVERVEAVGGDASWQSDCLRQVMGALVFLRLQREEGAQELRQMAEESWGAKPMILTLNALPARRTTIDGCWPANDMASSPALMGMKPDPEQPCFPLQWE